MVRYLPGEESAVHTYQSHLLVLKPCKCIIKKDRIVCACRSVAWAQPEVRYYPYFRNEGRERMVRQPSGTFGIVSIGRSFLVALTPHYRRVKVQGVIVKHQIRELPAEQFTEHALVDGLGEFVEITLIGSDMSWRGLCPLLEPWAGRPHFSRCSRKRIYSSILKNRESPPNGIISLSTNFISQSIIKSCSFQTVVLLVNVCELAIYMESFLMAVIRKRKKAYL